MAKIPKLKIGSSNVEANVSESSKGSSLSLGVVWCHDNGLILFFSHKNEKFQNLPKTALKQV